jgi:hypothetical protein
VELTELRSLIAGIQMQMSDLNRRLRNDVEILEDRVDTMEDDVDVALNQRQASVNEHYALRDRINENVLAVDSINTRVVVIEARLRGDVQWADAGVPGQGIVPFQDVTNMPDLAEGLTVMAGPFGEGVENNPPSYTL